MSSRRGRGRGVKEGHKGRGKGEVSDDDIPLNKSYSSRLGKMGNRERKCVTTSARARAVRGR